MGFGDLSRNCFGGCNIMSSLTLSIGGGVVSFISSLTIRLTVPW